jgi:hypothetical protein
MSDLLIVIDQAIHTDVEKWATAVKEAIDNVKPPQGPGVSNNAMFYAAAAAAGNMIWAATCLLAPEFAVPIRIMSFGGAGLASVSGILSAMPADGTPAPGPTASMVDAMKKAIEQARKRFLSEGNIAKLKTGLYRWIQQKHPDWLAKAGENEGNVRQMVWEHLYKSPYGLKGKGYSADYAADLLCQKITQSLTDYYAMMEERYKVYEHMVYSDALEKYKPVFHAYSEMDLNEFQRNRCIKENLTPNKFNDWLNRNSDNKAKLDAFKKQHLIPDN